MPIEIECPSGLKGRVRGLTGKDGRFLTDRKLTKSGQLMDAILEACWLETTDSSIYSNNEDLDWKKVLVGDRFYALVQIKIAAEEDSMHTFRHQCSSVSCQEGFDQVIDLDDLPVRMLSREQRDVLKQGKNEFEIRMPTTEQTKKLKGGKALDLVSGRKKRVEIVPGTGDIIKFKLLTGADESHLFKLNKQGKLSDNELIQSVSQRIQGVSIAKRGEEGEEYEPLKLDAKGTAAIEYLEDFSLPAIGRLLDRMDELDCGMETLIEIECPRCKNLMSVELPLDGSFFFPRKRRLVT